MANDHEFRLPAPAVVIPVRELLDGEDFTKWHNSVEIPALNQARAALAERRRQDAIGYEVCEIIAIMPKLDVDALRQLRRVATLLLKGDKVSWRVDGTED